MPARLAARFGAFGVNVGLQVASIEPQVLTELHNREAIFGLRPHVLIHPRHRHLQKTSSILDCERPVASCEFWSVIDTGIRSVNELSRIHGHHLLTGASGVPSGEPFGFSG